MTRDEAIREIREKTPQLLADYRAIASQIGEALGLVLPEGAPDGRPEMDAEELRELYGAILEFAQGYDIDSIDALLEQAKAYRVPEAEEERFAKVERLVRDSDWEGLKAALS